MSAFTLAISAIARALRPFAFASETEAELRVFVASLGWELPETVTPSLSALAQQLLQVNGSATKLSIVQRKLEWGDEAAAAELDDRVAALAGDFALLVASFHALPAQLQVELPPAYVAATSFDSAFCTRVFDTLVALDLSAHAPLAYSALRFAGLIEVVEVAADPAKWQPDFKHYRVRWDRVPMLLDPRSLAEDVYGWGTSTIDAVRLFDNLIPLTFVFGVASELRYPTFEMVQRIAPGAVEEDGPAPELWIPIVSVEGGLCSIVVYAVPVVDPEEPQSLALKIVPFGLADVAVPIGDTHELQITGAAEMQTGAALLIRPEDSPELIGDLYGTEVDAVSGQVGVAVVYDSGEPEMESDTAIAVGRASFAVFGDVRAGAPSVAAVVSIERAQLLLAPPSGDGFLSRIFPAEGLKVPFSLSARWDQTGVHFAASTGLDTRIAVGLDVGPVSVDSIEFSIAGSAEQLEGDALLSMSVALGPVIVGIDDVGLHAALEFVPGNLGTVDFRSVFAPPSGGRLVVDAGPVRGLGTLAFDAVEGCYDGAVALDVYGVSASAVATLDTRPPSGGYSLVAAISSQLSRVPLGLGFTLDGIGGLIGINRRVDTEALRAALRGSGIGDIFFATDAVSHAERLLGDLGRYFPTAEGRHVFGPAVKIGWGSPTLVEGVLALLLEVPDPVRLVLLGNVKTALPTKDNPIIVLNVDVVGEVDFSKKTLAIDAALRDSKVAGFPITGDMAVRLAWGDPPNFVVSVGGFHSEFRTPPGFPELRRIRIPIGSGENPRLDITGFLALTSNTAQVGAQAELYAAKAGLNILGSVGFETLIQFSPFRLTAHLWAGVALRRGSTVLAGVNLDGTLTGPKPWRVSGEACLSLWFTDLCVSFDATFGEPETIELPEEDIWLVLQPALEEPRSWSSALPSLAARVVTTAAPEANPPVLIDPASALSVRQKIIPLNRKIERFAQVKPDGLDRFEVEQVTLGDDVFPKETIEPIKDWFAPAQFENLSDAERLSRPGFEKMVAGVSVASTAVRVGPELVKPFEYETVLIPDPPAPPDPYVPPRQWQIDATATSANAAAPLRVGSLGRFSPPIGSAPLVALLEEEYVVASTEDLTWRLDVLENATSRSEAELALKAYLADNPAAQGLVQVVPRFEAVEAP